MVEWHIQTQLRIHDKFKVNLGKSHKILSQNKMYNVSEIQHKDSGFAWPVGNAVLNLQY